MSPGTLHRTAAENTRKPSRFDRWARALIHKRLRFLEQGSLTLVDAMGTARFGDPLSSLSATIQIRELGLYRSIALGGTLAAAESYMDSDWDSEDLTAVIRILARNRKTFSELERARTPLKGLRLALFRMLRRNTRSGSRRNIAEHYDLGNRFFEFFLDPTLTYSSGVFEKSDVSMEAASLAKYQRLAEKIEISAKDHVLEIGTGWGGFALFAAQRYGCRVTTATVSREQFKRAQERVLAAGLEGRIDVIFCDYRDIQGQYDKLVSIEMIEAVGSEHLHDFFRICSDRLRPHGKMALQAITLGDHDYASHTRSTDFIQRYIFPGGELVSIGALQRAMTAATDFRMTHLEDLTAHYAETLRRWRTRYHQNLRAISRLGRDRRFLRTWDYYFSYCEGGFEEREIGLLQVIFEKPQARRERASSLQLPDPVGQKRLG